ncbi:MAG: ATP-binding protein [Clostridiaceae bacterium]
MNDSLFNEIQDSAKYLNLDLNSQEMAQFAMEHDLGEKQLQALSSVLSYLQEKKKENIISTLLTLSRLPLKEPKTFENFDFNAITRQTQQIYSRHCLPCQHCMRTKISHLMVLRSWKTHLAMAYGRECCRNGMKAYFLKATELNQKLTDARKYGKRKFNY